VIGFSQYGPFELREGSWDTERGVYGRRVIEEFERYAPGFGDLVEAMEVLAPPDIEARFGLLGGNIMQGELTPDQMFSMRPIPGYGDYRTPVEGLYLAAGNASRWRVRALGRNAPASSCDACGTDGRARGLVTRESGDEL
jgi:phytoene dehydrogenase-like protein